MTHLLPPSLLRLFAPRPPLEFAAPLSLDHDPNTPPQPKDRSLHSNRKRIRSPLSGVASVLERVKQEAADRGEVTDDVAAETSDSTLTHTRLTLSELAHESRKTQALQTKQRGLETYDPASNPNATPDAYKTLFLARLHYNVTEKDLHREFDMYGPISEIKLIRDKAGKSRGYAFIAYERERDMKAAYKDAEGIKINGRRVMVDVERGRTVKDWKPTRLGGGLGGGSRKEKKAPEPADQPSMGGGFGVGFRGGRGGFRGGRGGFAPRGGGGFGGPRGGGFGGGRGGYGGDNGYGAPRGGGFGGGRGGGFGGGGGGYGPPRGGADFGGSGPNGYAPRSNGGGVYGGGGGASWDDPSGPPQKRSRY